MAKINSTIEQNLLRNGLTPEMIVKLRKAGSNRRVISYCFKKPEDEVFIPVSVLIDLLK